MEGTPSFELRDHSIAKEEKYRKIIMSDWDEAETRYNANPEKWLALLEVELTQQREAQNLRDATIWNNTHKGTRPKIGKRTNSERYQRGFSYQTFPPKATKRPTLNNADLDEEA